jgi:hypothetical protein
MQAFKGLQSNLVTCPLYMHAIWMLKYMRQVMDGPQTGFIVDTSASIRSLTSESKFSEKVSFCKVSYITTSAYTLVYTT